MKKIKYLVICSICAFVVAFTCGCVSEKVAAAQKAYDQKNYAEVINILEDENKDSGKAKELYNLSKAHLMCDEQKYSDAFAEILSVNVSEKDEFYNKIINDAISDSLEKGNAQEIIKMIKAKEGISDTVKNKYIEEADKLNIKSFKCILDVSNSDIGNDTKSNFTNFLTENKLNMPKAFVLGKWQRANTNDATKDVIVVRQQGDNLIGIYEVVGDTEVQYHKSIGEISWSNFNFLTENSFTFTYLGKTKSGMPGNDAGYTTIDYSNINTMTQTITPTPPYWTSDPTRVWTRIG